MASTPADTFLGIDIGGTSVKLAAMNGEQTLWTAKRGYRRPTIDDLIAAIREGIGDTPQSFAGVGLCVPGLLDERKERVVLSVNVPALIELPLAELVSRSLGRGTNSLSVFNDSIASGYDVFAARKLQRDECWSSRLVRELGRRCWTKACPCRWMENRRDMLGNSMFRFPARRLSARTAGRGVWRDTLGLPPFFGNDMELTRRRKFARMIRRSARWRTRSDFAMRSIVRIMWYWRADSGFASAAFSLACER